MINVAISTERSRKFLSVALLSISLSLLSSTFLVAEQSHPAHTFVVAGHEFLMDGKPYQIISGEMHYPRVPRAYWRDRFRKARAMGLNTITTYVFWDVHEPRPGVYDFSGQYDVAEYIREAQQEGLNVILRPGPYICAEWDLGGFPSWLLKDHSLVLRSTDPKYLAAMQHWFNRLGQEIKPLLIQNGGPIIAVQVENEYGSFGDDHSYMEAVKSALEKSGMAASVLYTADGAEQIPRGSLPELPAVANFGTGDAKQSFSTLQRLRPDGPLMSGEYWAGWFDHWGEKHHQTNGKEEADELRWMLQQGGSVSIYMFHGGTSFGWMNGANSNGKNYEPDTTSYDYDAPLDEQGAPRSKFFDLRDAITSVTHIAPPPLPAATPVTQPKIASHLESASLWASLPAPVQSAHLLTMEDLDQAYGYILYRTTLVKGDGGDLVLNGLHDYAQVYVDKKLIGTLDRRIGTFQLALPMADHAETLDILVENSGRVNFTKVIRTERKGLTDAVTIAGKEPQSWKIYPLPMSDVAHMRFRMASCEGPCFYRTKIEQSAMGDTYLDTRELQKGEMFLNGVALGRFWNIGPQHTLLLPGAWLQEGANEVVYFDLNGSSRNTLRGTDKPIFDQ